MKIETILNAMEEAHDIALKSAVLGYPLNPKHPRIRQYHAFRARILRTVATYRNFAEANGFDKEQAWFWTDEWQAAEKEVDKEIT